MADLDRNKAYGQVVNDTEGRFYEQDGAFFTADGKPWVAQDAAPAPKAKKGAANQLDAQLQEPA
jgi:hypothetical protein